MEKYLIFMIKEKLYAVPSKFINAVDSLGKVFPLPLTPDYVRGIINWYSVPYALIDMSVMLFNDTSDARKIIVLKEEVDKLAFLIDDVKDFADIPSDKLFKIDNEEKSAISAFFEWKDNHIFCLEIEEFIDRIQKDFAE